MSSFYHGDALELSIFGQSHSPAIGVTLSGLPAGFSIDMDELGAFLCRRLSSLNARQFLYIGLFILAAVVLMLVRYKNVKEKMDQQ